MKNYCFLSIIMCLILVLCGCNSTSSKVHISKEYTYKSANDQALEYQNLAQNVFFKTLNEKLYYFNGTTYMCYDPASNTQDSLCRNNQCNHISLNCPLYTISRQTFQIAQDSVYLERLYYDPIDMTTFYRDYISFDVETQESTLLRKNKGQPYAITTQLVTDKEIYYYYTECPENADDTDIQNYDIYLCVQLPDKTCITLFKDEDKVYDYIIGFDSNRVYLADRSNGIYYIDRHISGNVTKQYITASIPVRDWNPYSCVLKNNNVYFYSYNTQLGKSYIWKVDLDNQSLEHISEVYGSVNYSYYTNQYIYFRTNTQQNIGTFDDNGTISEMLIDEYTIYRVGYDGGQPECLFSEFPKGYETYSLYYGFTVSGRYLYSYYVHWGDLKDVYYPSDNVTSYSLNSYFRLDVETGEIFFWTPNE